MPTWGIVALVAGIVLFDLVVVVPAVLRLGWSSLSSTYGPAPVRDDAVRKNFQTIAIGVFNFGGCVHIAADEDHLHILPTWVLRVVGCSAASIPWSDLAVTRARGRLWRATCRAGQLHAPRWCLQLAERAS